MPVFSNYNRCKPLPHHLTHEVGGSDEIAGLGGTFTGRNGFDYTIKTDGTDVIAYDDEGVQVGSTRQDLAVLIETDLLPLKTTAAIKLTSGSFPLKTKLTISKNFGIFGNGLHATEILGVSNVADAMVELTSDFTNFRDVHLDGDGKFATGLAILCAGARVYDLQVSNTTGNGITCGDGATTFTGGYIIRPRINPTCLGHELEITNNYSDAWIQGGNFRGYSDTNSCIKVGEGVNHIQFNHLWGRHNLIEIAGGDNIVIEGNWIDDSYHDGILCSGYMSHSSIVGNHFRWNGKGHVETYGNIYCNGEAFDHNQIVGNNFVAYSQDYSTVISDYALKVVTTGTNCEVIGNNLVGYHAASGSRLVLGGAGNDIAHNVGA